VKGRLANADGTTKEHLLICTEYERRGEVDDRVDRMIVAGAYAFALYTDLTKMGVITPFPASAQHGGCRDSCDPLFFQNIPGTGGFRGSSECDSRVDDYAVDGLSAFDCNHAISFSVFPSFDRHHVIVFSPIHGSKPVNCSNSAVQSAGHSAHRFLLIHAS